MLFFWLPWWGLNGRHKEAARALNRSVEMGLVALERPPYDLLTVSFMKYNKNLGSEFVIQLSFNSSSPLAFKLIEPRHLQMSIISYWCPEILQNQQILNINIRLKYLRLDVIQISTFML